MWTLSGTPRKGNGSHEKAHRSEVSIDRKIMQSISSNPNQRGESIMKRFLERADGVVIFIITSLSLALLVYEHLTTGFVGYGLLFS